MRKAFIDTLVDIARVDDRIMLLTGDLGFMILEPFARAFPGRFLNVGVAEANMINVATGLALVGFIPFVYSAATFVSMRCYEQIRNGPVYHRLPLRIVGVGGGFDYGFSGYSHYGIEDVGVMRLQSTLFIVVPADSLQLTSALKATQTHPGPVYYRLGKTERTPVAGLDGRFEPRKCVTIGTGKNVLLITMGDMAHEVLAAADVLRDHGVASTTVIVSSFNPAPEEHVCEILKGFSLAISVEDHSVQGGLGSWTSELVGRFNIPCRLTCLGITDAHLNGVSGTNIYLKKQAGLSSESIADAALKLLGRG